MIPQTKSIFSVDLLIFQLFLFWVQKVELRSSKQKVKLKGQVTSQQDNLLSERQAAIEKAQSDNISLRNELARLKTEQEENKKKVVNLFLSVQLRKALERVLKFPIWVLDD